MTHYLICLLALLLSLSSPAMERNADFWRSSLAAKKPLPALDSTGKVHGELPKPKDIKNYTREELEQLRDELKPSVQKRIEVTEQLGRDKAHGQRQGAEQNLIKSIEKHLEDK